MSKQDSLTPLADRVILRADAPEEKSEGGIVLPEDTRRQPTQGTVVSVGRGARAADGSLIPMSVQEGDRVIFEKYAATEIEVGEEKLLVLHEGGIVAVLR